MCQQLITLAVLPICIDKCATASLVKGKLTSREELVITADTIIPALNTPDSYKYLGMFEYDKFKEPLVKRNYCLYLQEKD